MALRSLKMVFSSLPMRLETVASVHSTASPVRQASLLPRHIRPLALPFEHRANPQVPRTSTSHRASSSTAAEDIRQPQYDAYVWGSPEAVPTQQLAPCILSPAITHLFAYIPRCCACWCTKGTCKIVRRESATSCVSSVSPFNA